MAGRNNTRELGSVIAGMLAGLPHSGARKILECDAMQTLFECLPEHLKGKCAPAEIHYIKSGDGAPRGSGRSRVSGRESACSRDKKNWRKPSGFWNTSFNVIWKAKIQTSRTNKIN